MEWDENLCTQLFGGSGVGWTVDLTPPGGEGATFTQVPVHSLGKKFRWEGSCLPLKFNKTPEVQQRVLPFFYPWKMDGWKTFSGFLLGVLRPIFLGGERVPGSKGMMEWWHGLPVNLIVACHVSPFFGIRDPQIHCRSQKTNENGRKTQGYKETSPATIFLTSIFTPKKAHGMIFCITSFLLNVPKKDLQTAIKTKQTKEHLFGSLIQWKLNTP